MIDPLQFRTAMSRLGAAVNIITTNGPAGRHGMTASAVCSVSDDPASLLVCINRSARMHEIVTRNRMLCVNVLSAGQEALSGVFAGRAFSVEERFGHGAWSDLGQGLPALDGALSNLVCRVESDLDGGTHSIFLCHVEALRLREDGDGLVYFGRAYHSLPVERAA